MNTHEQLNEYLDGRLPPEQAAALERRLAEDQILAEAFDEMKVGAEAVRGLPRTSAPAGLRAAIAAKIDADRAAGQDVLVERVLAPRGLRLDRSLAAAGLLTAMLVGGSLMMLNDHPQPAMLTSAPMKIGPIDGRVGPPGTALGRTLGLRAEDRIARRENKKGDELRDKLEREAKELAKLDLLEQAAKKTREKQDGSGAKEKAPERLQKLTKGTDAETGAEGKGKGSSDWGSGSGDGPEGARDESAGDDADDAIRDKKKAAETRKHYRRKDAGPAGDGSPVPPTKAPKKSPEKKATKKKAGDAELEKKVDETERQLRRQQEQLKKESGNNNKGEEEKKLAGKELDKNKDRRRAERSRRSKKGKAMPPAEGADQGGDSDKEEGKLAEDGKAEPKSKQLGAARRGRGGNFGGRSAPGSGGGAREPKPKPAARGGAEMGAGAGAGGGDGSTKPEAEEAEKATNSGPAGAKSLKRNSVKRNSVKRIAVRPIELRTKHAAALMRLIAARASSLGLTPSQPSEKRRKFAQDEQTLTYNNLTAGDLERLRGAIAKLQKDPTASSWKAGPKNKPGRFAATDNERDDDEENAATKGARLRGLQGGGSGSDARSGSIAGESGGKGRRAGYGAKGGKAKGSSKADEPEKSKSRGAAPKADKSAGKRPSTKPGKPADAASATAALATGSAKAGKAEKSDGKQKPDEKLLAQQKQQQQQAELKAALKQLEQALKLRGQGQARYSLRIVIRPPAKKKPETTGKQPRK